MIKVVVFLFAIIVSLYTEKKLIPLCANSGMKFAVRWNYINSILMALAQFHFVLKCLHTAYIWIGCIVLLVAMDKRCELERQQKLEAKIAWDAEKVSRHSSSGCPAGYVCSQMGSDGLLCENKDACRGLIIPPPILRSEA